MSLDALVDPSHAADTPERVAPPAPGPIRRRGLDAAIVLLLMAFALLLRQWQLGLPETRYFDETYYAKAGEELLSGRPDSNTVHPPLAKLIIATVGWCYTAVGTPLQEAGWVGGVTAWAKWRAGSVLFGLLMIPLVYDLAHRLFRSRFCAVVATFLMDIDFLHLVQSRIAMLDMYLSFFVVLGGYAAWRFIEAQRRPGGWAVLSVLAFAIGFACKWNALFAGAGAFVAMLALKPFSPGVRGIWRWSPRIMLLYLVLVPLLYGVAFIPFLWQHGWDVNAGLRDAVKNHRVMIDFRYSKEFTHRYMSNFWSWPTMMRPVWYHYEEHKAPEGSLFEPRTDTWTLRTVWGTKTPAAYTYVTGILAMGSPFVWWTYLVFLLLTLLQSVIMPLTGVLLSGLRGIREAAAATSEAAATPFEGGAADVDASHVSEETPPPSPARDAFASFRAGLLAAREALDAWRFGPERPWLFLLLMYAPQVLLWSVNRGFLFYMLPCVPFMCIFIAGILREWIDLPFGRPCTAVYLGIATLFLVAYFPLLVGWSVPKPVYELLIFTPKWV